MLDEMLSRESCVLSKVRSDSMCSSINFWSTSRAVDSMVSFWMFVSFVSIVCGFAAGLSFGVMVLLVSVECVGLFLGVEIDLYL